MSLILGNAELKVEPVTLRMTHAMISAETEPLPTPHREKSTQHSLRSYAE